MAGEVHRLTTAQALVRFLCNQFIEIDGEQLPLFAGVFGIDDFTTQQTSTAVRMDRDICLVVDRSSSMKLDLSSTAPGMSLSGTPAITQLRRSSRLDSRAA